MTNTRYNKIVISILVAVFGLILVAFGFLPKINTYAESNNDTITEIDVTVNSQSHVIDLSNISAADMYKFHCYDSYTSQTWKYIWFKNIPIGTYKIFFVWSKRPSNSDGVIIDRFNNDSEKIGGGYSTNDIDERLINSKSTEFAVLGEIPVGKQAISFTFSFTSWTSTDSYSFDIIFVSLNVVGQTGSTITLSAPFSYVQNISNTNKNGLQVSIVNPSGGVSVKYFKTMGDGLSLDLTNMFKLAENNAEITLRIPMGYEYPIFSPVYYLVLNDIDISDVSKIYFQQTNPFRTVLSSFQYISDGVYRIIPNVNDGFNLTAQNLYKYDSIHIVFDNFVKNASPKMVLTVAQDQYDSGYNNGYNNGYLEGSKISTSDSYQTGFTDGQKSGYDKGYSVGVSSASDYSFFSLFTAVIDAPINALMSILNFEILGFNMKSVCTAILTALIVVVLWKTFSGGFGGN